MAENEASDVRPLGRMHRVGLVAAVLAIAALIAGLAGSREAVVLIFPGFVLFPYAADGLVILLYRAGVISAASANRLGCLHVTAIVLAVVVAILTQVSDSPGLVILLFPAVLLIGYRDEFVGSLGNALGRASGPHNEAGRTAMVANPVSMSSRTPTPREKLSRRLVVLTMPLFLVGLAGTLGAATGGGWELAFLGFGPPIVALLVFAVVRHRSR